MTNSDVGAIRAARRLALSGKLDLRPVYLMMAITLVVSYVSSMVCSYIPNSTLLLRISAFGMQHIAGVRAAGGLSSDHEVTVLVMTIQWLLAFAYVLVFSAFLSPFSKIVKVAVDKAIKLESSRLDGEDKKQFMRVIILVLGLIVLLGDIKLIDFPTFLNGGLFILGHEQRILIFLINSKLWMPALSWLIAFGTFMFYWGCFHLAVNYKTVFSL